MLQELQEPQAPMSILSAFAPAIHASQSQNSKCAGLFELTGALLSIPAGFSRRRSCFHATFDATTRLSHCASMAMPFCCIFHPLIDSMMIRTYSTAGDVRAASAVHFVHVPKNPSPPHAVICLRAHDWAEVRRCDELARNITCQHASHSRGVAFCSKPTCADRTRHGSHVQRGISFSRRVKRASYQIHKYILILLDSLILVRPVLPVSTDNIDTRNCSLVLLLFIQLSVRKLMMLTFPLLLPFILPRAFGCPQHENHIAPLHNNGQIIKPTSRAHSPPYWSYDASYDCGRLSSDYALC